jgi:hypothetical protein
MPLPIDIFESADSRATNYDADQGIKTQTRRVTVTGYTTPEEAISAALSDPATPLPAFVSGNPITGEPQMQLRSVAIEPQETPEIYAIVGNYESTPVDDNDDPISYTFSGTTTGASQLVTQGIAYQRYGTGPNYDGAINVDKDGVQGVEITIPRLEFQIDKVMPKGVLRFSYVIQLMQMTGKTNQAAIWGFAQGELLFLGAEFSQKSAGEVTISFKFMASPNVTGLAIGTVSGIDKKGHEYLWVDYKASESGGFVIRQPRTVHVHQVYDYADFSTLQI